jgi:hypothetical protein
MVVLMFYAVALSVAAVLGGTVLGLASYALTKHAGPKRKRITFASAMFPFVCVVFAGGWFVAYAVINYEAFHRDPGLGDSWETPLPNGYALMMIDTTDQGTVYNPKTQASDGVVASQHDSVFGVRQLQVSNNLIFGANDSGYFGRIGQESKFVDSYFELDTRRGTRLDFNSLENLRQQAAKDGVLLNLREFQSVFGDYRTTWFDYVAGLILFLIPATGFVFLVRWIWMVRRALPTTPVQPDGTVESKQQF